MFLSAAKFSEEIAKSLPPTAINKEENPKSLFPEPSLLNN